VYGQWVSARERNPKDGEIVVAACITLRDELKRSIAYRQNGQWVILDDEARGEVMYWLPIPEINV
jgi:hypothetical protein